MLPVEPFGTGSGEGVCIRWFYGVCVCQHCVVVSRGNLMAAVLRNIQFFHEFISVCV